MDQTDDGALAETLAERLRASGLGRVVDDLLALAQPAIRLSLTRVKDEAALAIGASKIGGEPDLPAETPWPTSDASAPLPFIAQIRLADIAEHDPEGDLPHEGLLSFFYALNEPDGELSSGDDPSSWRVLWTLDDRAPLLRHSTPGELIEALDSRFPPSAVSYERRLTLPSVVSTAVERIILTQEERRGYAHVTTGADVGYASEMDLRLLGYPFELEPGTFIFAYEAEHGGALQESETEAREREERLRALGRMQEIADKWAAPAGGYTSQWARLRALFGLLSETRSDDLRQVFSMALQQRTPQNTLHAMAERIGRADEEWRLLLQVYSNEEAEMDWAGGGVIHFGIKREALAARDFSRVWVSLQFL